MKALVCSKLGGPELLSIEELQDPEPGPGQVLIDVHAAGMNFPDTLIIQGKYQIKPALPFTPGAEAAGVITAIGAGVDRVEIGQRVVSIATHGAFAEKLICPASALLPVPDSMDLHTAAGFGMTYGTSYYALKQRAQLQPGETLLVLGAAGGVGLAAVELGAQMGARVIAAASTDEKLATAEAAGASELVNYSEQDLKARVKELTGGAGVDVVYDPVGGELAEQALRATAWQGRYLVIGFASGSIPSIPLNLALVKGCSIVGVFWGAWAMRDPLAFGRNFAELFRMHSEGRLKPLIFATHPLEDYASAYAMLLQRRVRGKVILQMRADEEKHQ